MSVHQRVEDILRSAQHPTYGGITYLVGTVPKFSELQLGNHLTEYADVVGLIYQRRIVRVTGKDSFVALIMNHYGERFKHLLTLPDATPHEVLESFRRILPDTHMAALRKRFYAPPQGIDDSWVHL